MNRHSLLVCCAAILFVMGCGQTSNTTSDNKPANNSKAESKSETASTKTSMQYLEEGSVAFQKKDYKGAIEPYRKAFDLEKKEQKLEKKWWFVLIDNLSIAYGITNDLTSSREVIEYGISKEPTYPLFYYNLADTYGEQNNEAKALENLALAYKYKDNVLDGEHVPDPTTDASFKFLMKSESFRKGLADIQAKKY